MDPLRCGADVDNGGPVDAADTVMALTAAPFVFQDGATQSSRRMVERPMSRAQEGGQ